MSGIFLIMGLFTKKDYKVAIEELNAAKDSISKAMEHLRNTPSVSRNALIPYEILKKAWEETDRELKNIQGI